MTLFKYFVIQTKEGGIVPVNRVKSAKKKVRLGSVTYPTRSVHVFAGALASRIPVFLGGFLRHDEGLLSEKPMKKREA